LPDCIPAPARRGYSFDGWETTDGVEYYGASGEKRISCYSVANDITLRAQWTLDEDKTVLPGSDFWIRENAATGWYVEPGTEEDPVFRSGRIGNNTNSWMETVITGPASFSFDWRVSCNSRGHYLDWSIDGENQATIQGETEWATVSATIPEGEHVVRFDYVKGSTGASGDDKGQVRNFTIDPVRIQTDTMQVLWDWTTNYWVTVTTTGYGTADFESGWVADGSNLAVTLVPSIHSYSISLSGDTEGVVFDGLCLTIPVEGAARTIAASIDEVQLYLVVSSAQGTATPAIGNHLLSSDEEVTATVVAPPPADGVRYVCTGWTGTGSVPASGSGSSATFTIIEDSRITWNWRKEYWIDFTIVGKGTSTFSGQWVSADTDISIPFSPSVPYYTLSLSGDAEGAILGEGSITVSATAPRSVILTVTEHTYETALDNDELSWTSGGASVWFPQVAITHDGVDAVRSGQVLGDDVSTLSTVVEGPGRLSWWWMLDAGGSAGVDVFVDDALVGFLRSASDWESASVKISDFGTHAVRFEFWNAGTSATATDFACLDEVGWAFTGQQIDFPAIGAQVATNTVSLEATASSGLPVAYSVTGPAVLNGSILSFSGAGTVTVTASQAGDDNWDAAEDVAQSFEVTKALAEVTLGGLEQTYDGSTHGVTVETVPEGLGVRVTYDGGEGEPVRAGEYAVVAEVADAKWEGSTMGTLVIEKGTQSIEFPEIGAQVVTNRVELGAVASSGLTVSYRVEGPGAVEGGVLSFTGVGTVTVVASQDGDENWEAAEEVSQVVEVSGMVTLAVESAHGTAVPGVGTHEALLGETVEASVEGSPEELGEGLREVCTGWRLAGADGEVLANGEGMSARFEMAGDAVLTWVWETQALVTAEGLAHGSAEGSGWYAVGATAVLTAVPEAGHSFTGWEVGGGRSMANPLEWTVRGPGLALATFYTTYYASGEGNDGADGLTRGTAKREISAALAEAAFGDEVVAAVGTYGAIAVPEGVSVRSDEGAEKTVIRGGSGTRCVEAAADTEVEGFALEGADVEGDGGGALLADGAELQRCILRGNKAGGAGGGAKGGVLVNCLLVGNEAASGGGASGAELRHCTVVRNAGGGAKGGKAVNCVFWANEGGDVEGVAVSYSFSNPAAAGQGNIEGDEPGFAGGGDWRLAYESPCVDAGTDVGVKEDLEGAPRPQPKVYGEALNPDMGCYEYVPKARFVWEKGSATPPYESWKDAAHDIQSALDISGSGDRVVVEAGTYGAITVSNAVILMGYRGAEATFIDGGNAERAVTMTGGGVLEGFTVRNGASEDCGGILADGGAVVRDVVVEGCRATGAEGVGGGLCLYGGSTAENVRASGNEAAYGGGIYAVEASAVEGCKMTGNEASARGGGAWLGGESRMAESVLESNTAVRGGGVYGENCEIADCELTNNVATGAGGGAAVVGGTFRNNRVQGNHAANGGGLWAQDTDGHDCLVTGNVAGRGAGVWSEGDGQLWNFTVADNAGTGAGVALRGETVLGNSIVWGNAGGNIDAEAGTEVRYSCASPLVEGEGNFAEEPAFVGAGDYHLRAGSLCVDTGEVQGWMAEAYDFDGQRRVEFGEEGDGRDIWVDVGTDEAANDAVGAPTGAGQGWIWRVVLDAVLQLQSTTRLAGAEWADDGAPFTATEQTWMLEEPFEGTGAKFYRLIWMKE
jgi:uncharacterized repeat protein (TIGR02543 family)